MKKVLGLDLGTTSIGWAMVNQAENNEEKSSIIRAGVRVNPLTTDEKDAFEKGKAVTTNTDRRLKRSMRRNLQRYKLRRNELVSILKELGWIDDSTILAEHGNRSTFETYELRSKACTESVSLTELARVLLMINKKRGYKSNRKANAEEDGQPVDGMSVAKLLYEKGKTPGQYCYSLVKKGNKVLPEFYASDLKSEFRRVWETQRLYYPEYLTEEFWNQIDGKTRSSLTKLFFAKYKITTADNKGKDKRVKAYEWRAAAVENMLPIDQVAYVLCDIAGNLGSSSGYLGKISDRSKELYFNKQTVGQYLYSNIQKDPHFSTKNKVFYRQDYLDEFEAIWESQASFHPELTDELKKDIRDVVIFYQRRLKSQKGLISYCEFESRKVDVEINGRIVQKIRGCKVAPVSSPLFQEFRMWQKINNIIVTNKETGEQGTLEQDDKVRLAECLKVKDKLSDKEIFKLLFKKPKDLEMNFKSIEGNETLGKLYSKFLEVVSLAGNSDYEYSKLRQEELMNILRTEFARNGFNTAVLEYDPSLPKEEYERQPLFRLWHLLYSYEGDKSQTGNASLINKIAEICGMPENLAKIIASVSFKQDYASLSHKAMRKILPYMMDGNEYSLACEYAGYRHSKQSLTKEEIENKVLKDRLDQIPKNSLRNPVVEKILNQMVNVINTVGGRYGKPDEIHIELARELKSSQEERARATESIASNNKENDRIRMILENEFHLAYVSRNDIVKYKLYEELKNNGYKTFYSNQYIPADKLFSREIDIEHIIPQAVLFNDSLSNKTLEFRDINLEKGKDTAFDYVKNKYGESGLEDYKLRVNHLFESGGISRTKRDNLLRDSKNIPEGFVERDLKDTQYIAKKAREILLEYVRVVVSTSGSITDKLREDWGLVNVMKELNMPKFEAAGFVETITTSDGKDIRKIKDWTKRNDHRHHAMDAITIAFTKLAHIQYLNNLNAKGDKSSSIYAILQKETYLSGSKRLIIPPLPLDQMRREVRRQLESILVSIKAKNKVMTENINRIRIKDGVKNVKCLTPRGLLHKEQVYGQRKRYETYDVAVNGKMTEDVIATVASSETKAALALRLAQFKGDPKKAFTGANSLDKNPVWLDANHSRKVPAKVKCVRFVNVYSIRKNIDPSLSVEKVMDGRVRRILKDRLAEFGNDPKKAFVNLDENPIWFNKEKGIILKGVTIAENFDLDPIRIKRDNLGRVICDAEGNHIPSDYVNFRNNHHAAIFEDADGNIQEHIVSFYEAVRRRSAGLPVVDKEYNADKGWKFLFTMKSNEMFVFPNERTGFDPRAVDLMDPENYSVIGPNLFRVQAVSTRDYWFRHHLETSLGADKKLKDITWKRITNIAIFKQLVKVRINHIGEIVSVGEYD